MACDWIWDCIVEQPVAWMAASKRQGIVQDLFCLQALMDVPQVLAEVLARLNGFFQSLSELQKFLLLFCAACVSAHVDFNLGLAVCRSRSAS